MKKERHKLARTTVDVYRVFKVRDIGKMLMKSDDGLLAELGRQIYEQTIVMLRPYVEEQNKLASELPRKGRAK